MLSFPFVPQFARRHIGPDSADAQAMLKTVRQGMGVMPPKVRQGGGRRPSLRILSGVTHVRMRAGRVGRAGMAAGRNLWPALLPALHYLPSPFPLVSCKCINDSFPYLSPSLPTSVLPFTSYPPARPFALALYYKSLARPSGCPAACLSASLSSALCPSRSSSLSSLLLLPLHPCCHLCRPHLPCPLLL